MKYLINLMHRKTTFTMKLERWLLIEFFFNLWVQLNRSKYDSMMTRRMHSAMPAYLLLFESLPRASREITWPQINLIGGFTSVLCCRRIGQANIEWYLYSLPKSISTYNHHQHHHHHQFFINMSLLLVYNLTHEKVGHCSFMTLTLIQVHVPWFKITF